jgi:hypothetical protein
MTDKELEIEAEKLTEMFGNKVYAIRHCETLISELEYIKSKIRLTVGVAWVSEKLNHHNSILEILKR